MRMMKTLLLILLTSIGLTAYSQTGTGWNRLYGDSITIMGNKFQIKNLPTGILTDSLLAKKANGNVTRIAINQLPTGTQNVYTNGYGINKTGSEPNVTFSINTTDIMTAQRAADSIANINTKVNGKTSQSTTITINGVTQNLSANRTWTIDKASVGLGNVDNTSDANKPISNAVQAALNTKQGTLVSGTNIKTVGGVSILGSGDIPISTNTVTSVFGRTGAVVATNGDYTTTQVTEGTNQYFTTARARSSISAGTGIAYNSTTGVISRSKRQETYAGATDASGNYTVTFGTAYSVAPNIQANLIGGTALQGTIITNITTTGFTVSAYTRATVSSLPVIGVLSATLVGTATNPLVGGNIQVLITEN